jgi:hypothetical protein
MAAEKGLEVLWSPVNQAWLILCQPGPSTDPEVVGVKNKVEEVIAYLEDERR